MKSDIVGFYWFSGTGNTLVVTRAMSNALAEGGITVNRHQLERSDPERVDLRDVIGLAFPVACQSTYPLVWDFVDRLPECDGTEIFMVDTLQSFSGAVVGPMGKRLRDKGYDTVGAEEIKMPSNLYPSRIKREKNERLVNRGLASAREYAIRLLEGTARWGRVPVLSDAFLWLANRPTTWKLAADEGKKFAVDEKRCDQCRICVKLCPVGNVTFDEFPRFGGGCQQCLRCISLCPAEAIVNTGLEFERYRALSAKEMLRG